MTVKPHFCGNDMGGMVLFLVALALRSSTAESTPCDGRCSICDERTVYCMSAGLTAVPKGLEPSVTYMLLSNNNLQHVEGDSLKTLQQLHFLYLQNTSLTSLHNQTLRNLTNLRLLVVSDNHLTWLPDRIFLNSRKLKTLYVNGNRLKNIGDETMYGLTRLEKLYVQNNRLASLSTRAWTDLRQLKILHLGKNDLTSIVLHASGLQQLITLESLHLNENRLTWLDEGTLAGLKYLGVLDLGNNMLRSIHPDSFRTLRGLQVLNLEMNQISQLDDVMFAGLRGLLMLNLNNNNIKFSRHHDSNDEPWTTRSQQLVTQGVRSDSNNNTRLTHPGPILAQQITSHRVFRPLVNLQKLFLRGNEMVSITRHSFSSLHNLEELDVSDNKIDRIDKDAFSTLVKLQTLNLSHNNLAHFRTETFASLRQLRYLHLSHNNIDSITNITFHGLTSLTTLDLSHNSIETIDTDAFTSMVSLTTLNLLGNPLPCTCGFVSFLKSLRFSVVSECTGFPCAPNGVSDWLPWGGCYGNCSHGYQRVRRRRVCDPCRNPAVGFLEYQMCDLPPLCHNVTLLEQRGEGEEMEIWGEAGEGDGALDEGNSGVPAWVLGLIIVAVQTVVFLVVGVGCSCARYMQENRIVIVEL